MISHKHKFIFIHIPKCAGSSIKDHFFKGVATNWRKPNYEVLYGWCPRRKIHLQHATAKQLLEEGLVSEENWQEYFKFTIVRNPWDRAYSDYLWIMEDSKIKGSFKQYIEANGAFQEVFTNRETKMYRGDHKIPQLGFFDLNGELALDFVCRFEHLQEDMLTINSRLGLNSGFSQHSKQNLIRKRHYSLFYGKSERQLIENYYSDDIKMLGYDFENRKRGLQRLKDIF